MALFETNKLGLLMVGASALTLVACGGGSDGGEEAADAGAAIERAADDAANAAGEAADAAGAAASDVADSAGDAMDSAGDAASGAMEDAGNMASDAADAAGEAASGAMDDAQDAMNDAADAAGDMVDDATTAATDAADGAMEDAGAALTNVSDRVSAETLAAFQGLTGDADAGRRVFTKCMSCHVVQEGQNRVGPSLHGIIGRDAGAVEGFRYSSANADSGITWTEPVMFAYLENPQEFIPGTTMAFPGLPSAQDRVDVIAYIKRESE